MPQSLIVLLGNDQQLKNQIYEKLSGKEQENQSIFLPYTFNIPKIIDQDFENSCILNTPSAIIQEDLISIWNNLIQISKLENLDYGTVIYCFTDDQNKLACLLSQIHTQIGIQNKKNGIIYLTQSQTYSIFSQIKRNKNFCFKNLTPKFNDECQIKKISQEKIKIILQEWNQIISKNKNQANFIQNILETQNFENILEKLEVSINSNIKMFNLVVNIRSMLEEKSKNFINQQIFSPLQFSQFQFCTNFKCKFLYVNNSSKQLEQIFPYQIDIQLEKPISTYQSCPECSKVTYFLGFYQIIDIIFQEFQFQLIFEIISKQSKQQKQEILQIMLLSNEDEEKTNVFSRIQQNDPSSNQKQQVEFVQSKLINEKYIFHNTPLLDFVKDKENIISGFREYFQKNDIHFFLIFVNHQRVDIMVQRISNIIKKFYSLERQRMALIVNSKQCEQLQHAEIEKNLNYFGFKSIIFLNSSDSPQNIKKMIFQCLENIDLRKFDFTNTMFEQVDERMDQEFKESLINVSKQIEEEQMKSLKNYLAQEKEEIEKEKKEVQMMESFLKNKKDQLNQRERNYQHELNKYKLTEKKLNF